MLRSEMLWLEALRKDTALELQEPIPTQEGSWVATVPAGDGSILHCTLLGWLEGEPYHRALESPETAAQIGVILAELHQHAAGWRLPPGFTRPARDAAYFEGVLAALIPAVDDGRIAPGDFAALARSVELLLERMAGPGGDQGGEGILHADTHKGNMLYQAGKIRLIDFSFCAFGNFLFDLGICFGDMKPELHADCLAGYRSVRPLPAGHEAWIEGLFLGSIVGTFSFWAANPAAQDSLRRKVPQVVRDYAEKFNRGELFWF
jgi:Ser/Thr protein kinase RdoA (MazF antagonist)